MTLRRPVETRKSLNLANWPQVEYFWPVTLSALTVGVEAFAVLEVYYSPNLHQTTPVAKRVFRKTVDGSAPLERTTTARVCGELYIPGGNLDPELATPHLVMATRKFRERLPWLLEHDAIVPKIFIAADVLEDPS